MHKKIYITTPAEEMVTNILKNILPIAIGHPLHVLLIDYNSTKHVTWNSPGPMCG